MAALLILPNRRKEMESRYKIIISNKNLYKEINLMPGMEQLTVGTALDMDVRLRKELFGEIIFLNFTRMEEEWKVTCSDNLYFKLGDVRKLVNLQLKHGTEIKVCCQNSNSEMFLISYMLDFDYEKKDYNRKIDISKKEEIKIGGGKESDILLSDRYIGDDLIVLRKQDNKLYLVDFESKYGTYVNGIRIYKQKEIREYDFFSIGSFSFYYRGGYLFTSRQQNICLNGLDESIVEQQSTVFEYPRFNRNTRIQYSVPEEQIEIQQPTSKPVFKKKSMLLTLLPAIVMLGMTIILRGIFGGGGSFVIYSAVSMSMGIIVSIATHVQDKKAYKEDCKRREEAYKEYIAEKERLIKESRKNELRIRNMIYESLENSLQEVEVFGKRLFEKTLGDKDYLHVYLGTGKIESQNQVVFNKQELIDAEDSLILLPEQTAQKYRYIEDAPIISDFNTACGIGVVGNKKELKQILKNMTLDLAIRHFFKEVHLAYILDCEYIEEFQWIRWLRNVKNEQLDVRNIVCDEESKNLLLETFYTILSGREIWLAENKEFVFEEQYIVFVTNTSSISRHPVSKYIQNCTDYGFTFVFLEEYEENLPMGCTEIIRLNKKKKGHALKSVNGESISEFSYPVISDNTAEEIALKLGAICVDEVSLEGQLTKNISLFELLDIISVEDLDLEQRWSTSEVYKTIAAPIGVKNNNEIVALDINDKSGAHGPHGLVAGTTGSGKSEILQTYILSINNT
jgi:S-DNA-T family DNA segregation ATPase FtsK/SpoIIIE